MGGGTLTAGWPWGGGADLECQDRETRGNPLEQDLSGFVFLSLGEEK
jgi:hypothetical protein